MTPCRVGLVVDRCISNFQEYSDFGTFSFAPLGISRTSRNIFRNVEAGRGSEWRGKMDILGDRGK